MNTGNTLFAQLMDYLPWSTFTRIVARYDGDRRVRTLSCGRLPRPREKCRAFWASSRLTYPDKAISSLTTRPRADAKNRSRRRSPRARCNGCCIGE